MNPPGCNAERWSLYRGMFERFLRGCTVDADTRNMRANLMVDIRWTEVPRAFARCLVDESQAATVRPLALDFEQLVGQAATVAFGTRDHAQIPSWFLQNYECFLVLTLHELFVALRPRGRGEAVRGVRDGERPSARCSTLPRGCRCVRGPALPRRVHGGARADERRGERQARHPQEDQPRVAKLRPAALCGLAGGAGSSTTRTTRSRRSPPSASLRAPSGGARSQMRVARWAARGSPTTRAATCRSCSSRWTEATRRNRGGDARAGAVLPGVRVPWTPTRRPERAVREAARGRRPSGKASRASIAKRSAPFLRLVQPARFGDAA